MKLYANIDNCTGKTKGMGDDNVLKVVFSKGNKKIYAVCFDNTGILLINLKTGLDEFEQEYTKVKGEKQKGESEFAKFRNDMAERANCIYNHDHGDGSRCEWHN
jgi:hypothetical protein